MRRQLLERALEALSTPVDGPTVFEVSAPAGGADAATAPAGGSDTAATEAPAS